MKNRKTIAIHAAGRTADINDLQLDKINVEFDKRDCS
jgi:pyruvate/2-oxoglutarate dehydrogenase complex dihydrolipoamide dehydrogenase (E3) component